MQVSVDPQDPSLGWIDADEQINHDPPTAFVAEVEKLSERGVRSLILNCQNVPFISTPGLGALVRAHCKLKRQGGAVKLCSLKPTVASVIHVTHLDRLFDILPDAQAARASFKSK